MHSSLANAETAVFAMGCFWCAEAEFRDKQHQPLDGISKVEVGYAGGEIPNPSYENHPGYREALYLEFDPKIISYNQLLDIFWANIDPQDPDGQFCDKGNAYTAAIYYTTPEQQQQAKLYFAKFEERFAQKLSVELLPYTTYYTAEDYHQNYKQKNPIAYKFYRWSCGRDQKLKQIWHQD